MKTQKLTLTCRYSEEDRTVTEIIYSSFALFLRKELKNARISAHNVIDE